MIPRLPFIPMPPKRLLLRFFLPQSLYLLAGMVWLFSGFSPAGFANDSPRIISLAPHLTEMTYSAGAGEQLVGVVAYSDFPQAAQSKPIIGSYNAINLEQIIALKPDIILSWRSGNRPQDYARLQQLAPKLGFRLIESEVVKLDDIPDLINKIGQIAGTESIAQAEAEALKSTLATLKERYQHKSTVTAFYQIWNSPLITMGKDQFISQGLQLCGAQNIFNDLGALTGQVSIETVLQRDPQLLLLGGYDHMQQAWKKQWQSFAQLQAASNNHIFLLNSDLYQRPTARFINALDDLCQKVDVVRKAQNQKNDR